MNAPEKSNQRKDRFFDRDTPPPALSRARRSGRAGCSTIKSELARRGTPCFAEDFYWEHSVTAVSLILMAIPNGPSSVQSSRVGNPPADKIKTPNCVYVG